MPTTLAAVDILQNKVAIAPAKAANAGGVAISGLEMSQNSLRLSWSEDEMETRLRDIMRSIHAQCVLHGGGGRAKKINYIAGANLAGFVRVADAMLAHGV